MNTETADRENIKPSTSATNTAAVVYARASKDMARVSKLLEGLGGDVYQALDGVDILKRYVQNDPQLIIIDNHLPKMSSESLLTQIAHMNISDGKKSKVLIICDDNNRDTIIKYMKPVKDSNGTIKLGMLVTPWKIADFYRQIINLNPEDNQIKFKVEDSLAKFRNTEIESLKETRLFLGVSEIGQGLQIELGNDRVLSESSDTADDYVKKIENALLSTSVEYIQFSLGAMIDMLPANVVALMMLINGFAGKHKKEILFSSVPPKVMSQIESFGLMEILPLEHEVDLF